VLNDDKHDSSSDEDVGRAEGTAPSYSYLYVVHVAEEETQSEQSCDDDDTE